MFSCPAIMTTNTIVNTNVYEYKLRMHSYTFVFTIVFIPIHNCLISSCRRDKILHLCNCVYEYCNYAMTPHLVSLTRRDKAITQLRNYAIVNTNE